MQLVTGAMDGMDYTHPAVDILTHWCFNYNCHRLCHASILEKLDRIKHSQTCVRASGGPPSRWWATRIGCSDSERPYAVLQRVGTFVEGTALQSLAENESLSPEHGLPVGPGSYLKHNEQIQGGESPTPLGNTFVFNQVQGER